MSTLLAIGTGKGLFLATSTDGRRNWQVSGPHFPMTGVYAVAIDKRRSTPRLLAGMTSSHFGPSVATSDDLGASWQEPEQPPVAFPADTGASLDRVWQLTPAGPDQPDVVWAGTQPSALFRSDDGGVSYQLVRGLWDHPHREQWGAGFGGQAVHTVLPHPSDADQVVVAMSTGGVYRTDDGGQTWAPGNTGIRAYFLPDEWPEFGQCVHKVVRDAGDPERLYAQNHHGVYRSDDGGHTWASIAEGLPSDFGFPIVSLPGRPDTVFTFPLAADGERWPVGHHCRVYRSADAGQSWQPLSAGLPEAPFYPSVLRDAMCTDDAEPGGVYLGTRSGEVYASRDEGESWALVAAHLPDVLCVRAAEV
ncbi:exo-alpha-sialidase [Micromonospora sp. NPDC094482]|uniref:WD40/YVTN/BNR-like repeat-containing protein n=1 Tax=unclassified Micromonospora TaxID=2617518 RepID=UPI00332533FD